MAEAIRAGCEVEVVDDSALKGKRKLPFAKGARFTVEQTQPGVLKLRGVGGYWKAERFEVVGRG